MIRIEKLWFEDGRIYICTDDNHVLSRPLEAFPTLKDATEKEKLNYKIDKFGDAIRWEDIDEDIHISSFYEDAEPDNDNEIERMSDHIALSQAISKLPPIWRQIVVLRYYKNMTQQETANCLGLSQVKVSREEKKIMAF